MQKMEDIKLRERAWRDPEFSTTFGRMYLVFIYFILYIKECKIEYPENGREGGRLHVSRLGQPEPRNKSSS